MAYTRRHHIRNHRMYWAVAGINEFHRRRHCSYCTSPNQRITVPSCSCFFHMEKLLLCNLTATADFTLLYMLSAWF